MTEPKAPRNVTRRWLGAAGAGALLTSLAASASTIAFQQEGEINHALGVSESGTGYGGTEFTADGVLSDQGFNNYITAAYQFCEREEEEGSVLLYNKDNALPRSATSRPLAAAASIRSSAAPPVAPPPTSTSRRRPSTPSRTPASTSTRRCSTPTPTLPSPRAAP